MQHEVADDQSIKELEKSTAWDTFIQWKKNTGFMQSSWWADFNVAACGQDKFGIVVKYRDTIVGGAVILKHRFTSDKCYYYIDEGPVVLDEDSIEEQEQVFLTIMEFIEKKRQKEQQVVSHLMINPRWEYIPSFVRDFHECKHYSGMPRNTQCIDLTASEDVILGKMKQNGRYNIGVARRHGVSVVEDDSPKGIEDFLNIQEETFARKNLGRFDQDYFRALATMLSATGRGLIVFAEFGGARLATALVVCFGRTATYFYGGSRATNRNVMAPYLLQFEIMRKAKALGCQCYDLFGITPKNEPRNRWTDISTFKRKFGGEELHFVPTLDYVYDPVVYQEWEAWKESSSR